MATEQKFVKPGGELDKLAKLLAAENIMIEHKPIKTAYFDVKNRVLALPMWKEMTVTLYHLLVLHEVGHALETPADGWKGAIDKVKDEEKSSRIAQTFQGYLNVVEDARIERKIKNKFPGSRKDFIDGYNWLHEQDFFSIKNENIDKLSLIDRINLYFKLGTRLRIKFTDEERQFVVRAEQTITFDDVIKLAEDLLAYSKKKKEEQEQEQEEERIASRSDDSSDESDEFESDDFDDEESESGDDSDELEDSDELDESTKKSRNSESKEGGPSQEPILNADEAKTDRAMNDRMEELLDESISDRTFEYIYFPKDIEHEPFVVNYKTVLEMIESDFSSASRQSELISYRNMLLTRFRSENSSAINYMIKEFEMKKAAVAYSRSKQAKTGVIDVNKLHSYKFNDDIFKRLTIEPTGKNHGIVAILDMSGSMTTNYKGAMDQLICLTMFCRRVGIPHRIYGFTSVSHQKYEKLGIRKKKEVLLNKIQQRLNTKSFVFPDMEFNLLEFFHEKMSLKEFNTMIATLLLSSKRYDSRYDDDDEFSKGYNNPSAFIESAFGGHYRNLSFLSLGGTPLNDAIMVSRDLLAKFRKEKNIQIMNFVCITDGESNHTTSYTYRESRQKVHMKEAMYARSSSSKITNIFIDEESRMQTTMNFDCSTKITAMFARTVRFSQNATFVGFYIVNGSYDVRHVSYRYLNPTESMAFQAAWKKEKGVSIPNMLNFDEFYIIQGGRNLQAQQAKFDSAQDLKKGQLARAFISAQNKRGASRLVLNKFISKIAA